MILSFKERFKDAILFGDKIHTIREDYHNRWRIGMPIHFATGVRTRNYNNFMIGECTGIDAITIRIMPPYTIDLRNYSIVVDETLLSPMAMERLAMNDGLTIPAFMRWFNKDLINGKLIYWTRNANIY